VPRFAPAGTEVAHERVDNEVIAINLTTGAYFSLVGPAADCWTLLASGVATQDAAAAIAQRYDAERAAVERDLGALLERLVAEGLLRGLGDGAVGEPAPVELPAAAAPLAYRTPTLDKYDDMEELLLLDPIHEVDEAGWPLLPTQPA